MLVPLESLSAVLAMIRSKSASISATVFTLDEPMVVKEAQTFFPTAVKYTGNRADLDTEDPWRYDNQRLVSIRARA